MRQIIYKIQRFDGQRSFVQEYSLDYEAGKTILWGLLKIKDELDPSLTFVAACRSAVCGACAVRVNEQAMLACSTALDDVLSRYNTDCLRIEPINNFGLIRDLVVDWEPKTARLSEVKPWLIADEQFSPETGCRQSTDDFKKINVQANCILCGACASECNKLSINASDFYEPYIYTKAQKFIADSRDGAPLEHLKPVLEQGAWKCVHCQECATKCPKGLSPVEDMAKIRQAAIHYGITNNTGARHALAFYDDIQSTGRLNEIKLGVKTEGLLKAVSRLPLAFRFVRRGKLNPLHFPAPVKGIEQIRAIVKAVKEAKK